MTRITRGGIPTTTIGKIPKNGTKAPAFELTTSDLSKKSLSDYIGFTIILNVFPSIETRTCAASVRTFNKLAASIENTKVLCISKDLPFAQNRFCAAEGIEDVITLSDFADGNFGKNYGLEITSGSFTNLLSRSVIVIDPKGFVTYSEQIFEIGNEPNYDNALAAIK